MLGIIIAVLVTLVIAVPVSSVVTTNYQKKSAKSQIGNAEAKAREIIDEALTTAETKKREGILEIKEESISVKNELDKEIKERRAEIQKNEDSYKQHRQDEQKFVMMKGFGNPEIQQGVDEVGAAAGDALTAQQRPHAGGGGGKHPVGKPFAENKTGNQQCVGCQKDVLIIFQFTHKRSCHTKKPLYRTVAFLLLINNSKWGAPRWRNRS